MDLTLLRIAVDLFAALVFLNAAAAKLRAPATFEGQLDNYRLLPAWATAPSARAIPIAEGLVGAGLVLTPFVVGRAALAAPVAAAALLAVFASAMAINLGRGRTEIDCGCGDAEGRQPLRWALVGRNLGIAAALLVGAMLAGARTGWLEAVEAGVSGLVAFILYLTHERLSGLPSAGVRATAAAPTYGPAQ